MSTSDLLALRIRQLMKKPDDIAQAASLLKKTRFRSKEIFERCYERRLRREVYKPGDLVLVCNKAVEQSADRKHHLRYLGPFQVVRQTKGGSYVVSELDGAIWRQGVVAFRLLPFISREQVEELNWMDEDEDDEDEEDLEDVDWNEDEISSSSSTDEDQEEDL
ncbi:hypothetical protein EVJ58_g6284 [Rhodofomes roseus]|uniref:Uncharacterized protein n=1 Tax=Rhodofomes roseus TaxID=34475 RepID=A0A4Y9YAR0_9APHY|nr:hypothetical protein EVJ58_g6284 [Rhodofomes roseus]